MKLKFIDITKKKAFNKWKGKWVDKKIYTIVTGTVGSSGHLDQISERVVVVHVLLTVVTLSIHNDDQMGVFREGPAESARNDDDLDGSGTEKVFDYGSVTRRQTFNNQ